MKNLTIKNIKVESDNRGNYGVHLEMNSKKYTGRITYDRKLEMDKDFTTIVDAFKTITDVDFQINMEDLEQRCLVLVDKLDQKVRLTELQSRKEYYKKSILTQFVDGYISEIKLPEDTHIEVNFPTMKQFCPDEYITDKNYKLSALKIEIKIISDRFIRQLNDGKYSEQIKFELTENEVHHGPYWSGRYEKDGKIKLEESYIRISAYKNFNKLANKISELSEIYFSKMVRNSEKQEEQNSEEKMMLDKWGAEIRKEYKYYTDRRRGGYEVIRYSIPNVLLFTYKPGEKEKPYKVPGLPQMNEKQLAKLIEFIKSSLTDES